MVVAGIIWPAPFPSELNMATAVQPNELVFEFASNGMDEIHQVRIELNKTHLGGTVCCSSA